MQEIQPTEAEIILEAARKPEMLGFSNKGAPETNTPILFLPEGYDLKDMEYLLLNPRRHQGTVRLHDDESFIAYVKEIGSLSNTRIYIDADYAKSNLTVTAIFNDHADAPGWRDHRAVFVPRQTEEWKRWLQNNAEAMNQQKFAHFLEANLTDIRTPNGADVLMFATNLEETRNVKYRSGVNLANGMMQLEYIEEGDSNTKGKLDAFKEFTLGIRPFFNGDHYEVKAFLRYRIERNSGEIKFFYELQRADRVIEDATKTLADKIKAQIGFPTYFGQP